MRRVLQIVGIFALVATARAKPATAAHDSTATPVSHVFVLGDSISQGVGAECVARSYAALLYHNDDVAYPDDRGRDVVALFGPNVRYINVARDGDGAEEVRRRQLSRLMAPTHVDVAGLGNSPVSGHVIVVMTVGGNDLQAALRPNPDLTGPLLRASLANVRAIIEFFHDTRRFPDGASVFLGCIYDITDGTDTADACLAGLHFPGFSHAIDVWTHAYAELARSHGADFVDMRTLFRGHGFFYDRPDNRYHNPRDPTLWIYDRDCVHPNNLGHHMLRRAFYAQIYAAFAGRRASASR